MARYPTDGSHATALHQEPSYMLYGSDMVAMWIRVAITDFRFVRGEFTAHCFRTDVQSPLRFDLPQPVCRRSRQDRNYLQEIGYGLDVT